MSSSVTDELLLTTFGSLSWKGWLSLAFTGAAFIVMIFDWVGPDLVMNFTLALMVVFEILPLKLAVAGFANTGLLTVVTLFIVAAGITSTGGADWLVTKLLGTPSDTALAQVRMCLVTLVFSTFVNDTPVFCIMAPIVLTWAAKARLNPKQLMVPLSYCALLGGLNTVIGTSTNLVVSGLFTDKVVEDPESPYYVAGSTPLTLFSIGKYGVPNGIWGICYIIIAAPFLLPGGAGKRALRAFVPRRKRAATAGGNPRPELPEAAAGGDFFWGLLVTPASPAVGRSIAAAGLRQLRGAFLTSVGRGGEVSHAVGPDFVLQAGDVLYFSGIPDTVDQVARDHGLVPYSDATEELTGEEAAGLSPGFGVVSAPRAGAGGVAVAGGAPGAPAGPGAAIELVQATVRRGAPIAGKTIRESAFRTALHAAVVSVQRRGVPLLWAARIGEEVLLEGDVLLLDVAPQFWNAPEVTANLEDVGAAGQVRSHQEFLVAFTVGQLLAGRTVKKAGLRQLPNAFLAAIDRGGKTLHAVSPDEALEAGDVAWFAANADSVRFLRNTPGLTPLAEAHSRRVSGVRVVERRLAQAIVAEQSPLVGRTIAEIRFRDQFNAAVLAVSRAGARLLEAPGAIKLRAGDILLLDAGPAFARAHADSRYFSVVIEMAGTNPPRLWHTAIAIAATAAAFFLYAFSVLDILLGAAFAAAIMLLTGCLSGDAARRSINWTIFLTIAGSFGVSAALENSGAAAAIGNGIVSIGRSAGGNGFVIAAIYLATTILSQIVANNAAAAIVWPIAATASKTPGGPNIYIVSYAVMLGASSVFMSFFGYQTNLLAYSLGGHTPGDFLRYGSPMQVLLAVVSIVSLLLPDQWGIVWAVTGVVGAIVLSAPQVAETARALRRRRNKKLAAAGKVGFESAAVVKD